MKGSFRSWRGPSPQVEIHCSGDPLRLRRETDESCVFFNCIPRGWESWLFMEQYTLSNLQQACLAFTKRADFLTNILGDESDQKSIFQLCFGSRKIQGRVNRLMYSYLYNRLQSFYASYKIKAWHHFQVLLPTQLISHFICLARWSFVCGLCVCIFSEFLIGQQRKGGRSLWEATCCVPPGLGKAKETWYPNGTCVSRLEMTGTIDETWVF